MKFCCFNFNRFGISFILNCFYLTILSLVKGNLLLHEEAWVPFSRRKGTLFLHEEAWVPFSR